MRITPADLVLTRIGLRVHGRLLPCTVGAGGVRRGDAKCEGDGATPTGIHQVVAVLYRPDRLPAPGPWARPIGPADLWSDDPAAPDYNHAVRAPYTPSHERLRRADPQYDIVLVSSWNWPKAVPGKGSAIFLHQWRRPGSATAGCIAFARSDLLWLAARIRPGTRIIVPPALAGRWPRKGGQIIMAPAGAP